MHEKLIKTAYKLLLAALSLTLLNGAAEGKVYLLARNCTIPFIPNKVCSHSFIVVIPDDADAFAKKNFPDNPNLYKQNLELNFSNAYGTFKGFIISATDDGSENLFAGFNLRQDIEPAGDFFAQRNSKRWRFAGGPVTSDTDDTEFCSRLYQLAQNYISNTKNNPYKFRTLSGNCNSFAYSILVHSNAAKIPALNSERWVAGSCKLLPECLFNPLGCVSPPCTTLDDALKSEDVACVKELWPEGTPFTVHELITKFDNAKTQDLRNLLYAKAVTRKFKDEGISSVWLFGTWHFKNQKGISSKEFEQEKVRIKAEIEKLFGKTRINMVDQQWVLANVDGEPGDSSSACGNAVAAEEFPRPSEAEQKKLDAVKADLKKKVESLYSLS